MMTIREVQTPLGDMRLVATADGLAIAAFAQWQGGARELAGVDTLSRLPEEGDNAAARHHLDVAAEALTEYFEGDGIVGPMPELDPQGTELQREVWLALTTIPSGVTRTYSEIAQQVGRPTAVRAVAAAIGANPVGVLVPCHRVIGADGSLTGYAGGLERKRWLLAHEGAALAL